MARVFDVMSKLACSPTRVSPAAPAPIKCGLQGKNNPSIGKLVTFSMSYSYETSPVFTAIREKFFVKLRYNAEQLYNRLLTENESSRGHVIKAAFLSVTVQLQLGELYHISPK